jgi:hypothetical protein
MHFHTAWRAALLRMLLHGRRSGAVREISAPVIEVHA